MDPKILRALLTTWTFKHGVRSMSAIIGMSSIADRQRFSLADLPADRHLLLHAGSDFIEKLA